MRLYELQALDVVADIAAVAAVTTALWPLEFVQTMDTELSLVCPMMRYLDGLECQSFRQNGRNRHSIILPRRTAPAGRVYLMRSAGWMNRPG